MGAGLLLGYVLEPANTVLDWKAGHARIDSLKDDEFTTQLATLEEPESLREELHAKLTMLEDAHDRRDFDIIPVQNGTLWVTGGMSWGDSPTELFDALTDQDNAVLDAVGFRTAAGASLVTGEREPEVIQTAIVSHKHGNDLYASRTVEGLNRQLAEYCREWWDDSPDPSKTPPADDAEVVAAYFMDNEFEFVDIGISVLGD